MCRNVFFYMFLKYMQHHKKMSILFGVDLSVLDDRMPNIPIAACYMPFYIDQDMGWSETWSSFSNVGNLSERSIVRLYLTGIVDDCFFSPLF